MDLSAFACHQCGICCRWPGSVLLTKADITAISATLQLAEDDFIQRHTILSPNRRQLSLKEAPDGSCEFLGADNRCRIYDARPKQCRDFPYRWRADGCPALEEVNMRKKQPV